MLQEKDDPFLENNQIYQIAVYTGNKRGLASEASVKLKIHGSSMETNWIKLTDSQVNEVKFQKNQVFYVFHYSGTYSSSIGGKTLQRKTFLFQKDIFTMETEELGDLVAVSIGHNKAAPGRNLG